jgi:hypothetical protein
MTRKYHRKMFFPALEENAFPLWKNESRYTCPTGTHLPVKMTTDTSMTPMKIPFIYTNPT